MIIRSRDDIYASLLGNLCSRMGVTDIRAGGNLVQIAAVLADELYAAQLAMWEVRDAAYQTSATGADLDAIAADVLPSGLRRLVGGTRATGGSLYFVRSGAVLPAGVIVPSGTGVVRQRDNKRYITTSDSSFVNLGDLVSTPVSVVATTAGSSGNCSAGEINMLAIGSDDFQSCYNGASITNGADEESDDSLRERMRDYTRGLSGATKFALMSSALGVSDDTYGSVRNATVVYDARYPGVAQLVIDDGAGTAGPVLLALLEVLMESASGGETILYTQHRPIQVGGVLVKNAGPGGVIYSIVKPWGQVRLLVPATAGDRYRLTYGYYGGLCDIVQERVNGDLLNILETPDVSGAGCEVTVVPASKYGGADLDITAKLTLGPVTNLSVMQANIKRAISQYVNALDIGEPLYRARLYEIIMAFPDVLNVSDVSLGSGGNADVVPTETQVIRTADSVVTLL